MIRTKLGLLGLCALVLGLMAFGTAGAQASPLAKWLILNSKGELKTGSELHALVGLEPDTPTIVLHSEILKIKTLFVCTGIKAIEAKLLPEGTIGKELGVPSGSKVLFSGCTTELNNAAAPECTPETAGVKGHIVTNPGHALLVLHELADKTKDDLVEVIPDVGGLGGTFVTIKLPAACPIGTSVPVLGSLFLKDCNNLALSHEIKHLVVEGPLTELFTISKTAEHKASLLGSAWAFLENSGTETHSGLKWDGDPL